MKKEEKVLVWLKGEIKTPPFSEEARIEAGFLLRQLQSGLNLLMPFSRPLNIIGRNCHELRIKDQNKILRIVHKIDDDAIVILEVFQKQTEKTPQKVISNCKIRLKLYNSLKER